MQEQKCAPPGDAPLHLCCRRAEAQRNVCPTVTPLMRSCCDVQEFMLFQLGHPRRTVSVTLTASPFLSLSVGHTQPPPPSDSLDSPGAVDV